MIYLKITDSARFVTGVNALLNSLAYLCAEKDVWGLVSTALRTEDPKKVRNTLMIKEQS